jgi:hypothetical protein
VSCEAQSLQVSSQQHPECFENTHTVEGKLLIARTSQLPHPGRKKNIHLQVPVYAEKNLALKK